MARRRASGTQQPASVRVTSSPLLRGRPQRRFTQETVARRRPAAAPVGNALTPPPAGETHTYEADQDGDLNLQLTMVSFADAKAKKGETYVVYAAADDGTVACVYQTPWRNG